MVEKASPHEVVIRTLDVGGDKIGMPGGYSKRRRTPRSGCARSASASRSAIFSGPSCAVILRATAHGNIKILIPMISGLPELYETKKIMEEVKAELRAEGKAFNENVEIGVMIEIPSAAMIPIFSPGKSVSSAWAPTI